MKKDSHPFCYFVDHNGLVPAILHENKLIEAVIILYNLDSRCKEKLKDTKDFALSEKVTYLFNHHS